MFNNLKLRIAEKCINRMKEIKQKYPDIAEKRATKYTFKILRNLDLTYKKLILIDELLETLYGLDSQIYLDWKDNLNTLSIDKDRQ